MRALSARFLRDDSGATAIEYGLIVSLIFLAIVGSVTLFADTSTGLFNQAMSAIDSAVSGGGGGGGGEAGEG